MLRLEAVFHPKSFIRFRYQQTLEQYLGKVNDQDNSKAAIRYPVFFHLFVGLD